MKNHELGVFEHIGNFIHSPKTKALGIASALALGGALGAEAQDAPSPQETQDPNKRYDTVFIANPSSINFRAEPDRDSARVPNVDISRGSSVVVSLMIQPQDGYDWARIWSIDGVDVQDEVYVITNAIDMSDGVLVPVGQEEPPIVAAPEPPAPNELETQPAPSTAPDTVPDSETWALPTSELEVTPQMTSTEEAISSLTTEMAEQEFFGWEFEVAQEMWIGQGDSEVGPFTGLNPVLFINTQRAVDAYGTLTLNDAENSTPELPFINGGEMRLSGLDAWRLSIYQSMAHNLGLETQEEFEAFMQNIQPGVYEGTFMGINPITGIVEEIHYDPAQPVTIMNMGVWDGADNIGDREVVQQGIWNNVHSANQVTVNENGGLVVRLWMMPEYYEDAVEAEQDLAAYPQYSHRGMERRWYSVLDLAILRINVNEHVNGITTVPALYNSVLGEGVFPAANSADDRLFSDGRNGAWPYIEPGTDLGPDSDNGIGGPETWPFKFN